MLCSPRTDTQTNTKVNTEDTLSGFQEFFLHPIIKHRSNCYFYNFLLFIFLKKEKQVIHVLTTFGSFGCYTIAGYSDIIVVGKTIEHRSSNRSCFTNKSAKHFRVTNVIIHLVPADVISQKQTFLLGVSVRLTYCPVKVGQTIRSV